MYRHGIFNDLSNNDYHSDPAISRSGVMMFADSPYKYWANYLNPNRPIKKSTDAMDLGSAFHTLILEPLLFQQLYFIKPTRVYLKYDGKDKYESYKRVCEKLENSDFMIIENEDYEKLLGMQRALKSHKEAWELIQNAKYEQSYFWEDKESGMLCKARPDILHDNMIIDLKTCASASSRAYQRAMVDGGYHVQGAIIREAVREIEGNDIPNVINICIEKTYPYAIGIKIISESALDAGLMKFRSVLVDLKRCMADNSWNDYQPETVDLPGWAT